MIIILASAACLDDEDEKNRPPVARAEPRETFQIEGGFAEVQFSAASSTDEDGDTLTYTWDFDASDGDNNIDSTEKSPTYKYFFTGTYTVTLRVSDGKLSSTDTTEITVVKEPGNVEAIITTEDELKDTVHEDEAKTINFAGSSSTTKEGDLIDYEWDLNYTADGQFDVDATGEEVSHDFESGVYWVALRVRNDTGAEDLDKVIVKMNYNMSYNDELETDESKDYYFPLNNIYAYYLRVALVYNNSDNDGHDLDIYLYFPNGTEANNTDEEDAGHEEIRYDRNGQYGENLEAMGEWKVRIYNDEYYPLVGPMDYYLYIDVVYFS